MYTNYFRRYFQLLSRQHARYYCSKIEKDQEPIKFSTSRAAQRMESAVVYRENKDFPWYQPYVVTISVAVFLIYFCVFREENDIDLEFNKTLYERIDGMEKVQLIQSYKYNKEHGLATADIEKRLLELETKSTS